MYLLKLYKNTHRANIFQQEYMTICMKESWNAIRKNMCFWDLQNPDVEQLHLFIIVSLFEALHVATKKKSKKVLIFKKTCFNAIKCNLKKDTSNFKLSIKRINMMSKLIGINTNYRHISTFCLFYFFIFTLFRHWMKCS